MKRIVLLLLIIGAFLALCYWLWLKQQQTLIRDKLSPRAQEFISDQQKNNDKFWLKMNLQGQRSPAAGEQPQTYMVGGCFSVRIPFPVTDVKEFGQCFKQYTIDKPKGLLVVYMRPANAQSLDELTDIVFRREHPQEYQEEKKQVHKIHYMLFRKLGATYERSAFYFDHGNVFVFNLLAPTNRDLDADFFRILESVRFYPGITFIPTPSAATISATPTP